MRNATSNVMRFEHPGRGSRAWSTPRGREQLQAKHEIAVLLGSAPCRRDMLIEYLRLVQDAHHQISAPHLAALAEQMRLAYAEVHETATSYAHFDVVEDEPNLAPTSVRVRSTVTCAMFGAETLCEGLEARQAGGALPGGASGGILPGHMNDIPSVVLNLMRLFEDESSGQCAPCRTGTQKARVLMEQGAWNKNLLWISQVMFGTFTYSLGQAASNLLTRLAKYCPHLLIARRAAA